MSLVDLHSKLSRDGALVAGVLSGTSADGIDVALARLAVCADGELGRPDCLAFETLPFAPELAARLRAVLDGAPIGLRELALLDRDLGCAFGAAAAALAARERLELDLVGSHGQTIFHHDGLEESGPATLQIGDGDQVAHASGAWVVSDFRQADVAAGGEGAPIGALVDPVLFPELERPAAILNLGGMANLSLLLEGQREPLSFDTSPAGALLDGLARRLLGRAWDEGGAEALRGRVCHALVSELGEHPFLHRDPPKSTGRDTFGEAWLDEVVERAAAHGLSPLERDDLAVRDLLASSCELIAASVADALERHAPAGTRVVLAGGGARNRALVQALARRLGEAPASSAEHGVDPDAREALIFAVLAARCVLGRPSTAARTTGAAPGSILGKISAAPVAPEARSWGASAAAGISERGRT